MRVWRRIMLLDTSAEPLRRALPCRTLSTAIASTNSAPGAGWYHQRSYLTTGSAAAEAVQRAEVTGPETALALDAAQLARQVEDAVEAGLDQTLAAHFGDPEAAVIATIEARAGM